MSAPDNGLVRSLKQRAAALPAEHVQVFVEFLAQNAELFGLLPGQTAEGTDALDALFTTFIPEQRLNLNDSHRLFQDILNDLEVWETDAVDGDRDAAERNLDMDLRILVPPRRTMVTVDKDTGDFLVDIRVAS